MSRWDRSNNKGMNFELFNQLIKERPSQQVSEWRTFLEICEVYLQRKNIKHPVVVELGVYNNMQKKFYQQLLNAEHIGIDAGSRRSIPDIHGNTHDPETLRKLKNRLANRPINILFIDAGHSYESVKKDYEMYTPLCTDIIALHDIEIYQYKRGSRKNREVQKFWNELKQASFVKRGGLDHYLFLTLGQYQFENRRKKMGIGMIIKR